MVAFFRHLRRGLAVGLLLGFSLLAAGCKLPAQLEARLPTLVPTLGPAASTATPTLEPGQPTATAEATQPAASAQCPASPPQRVDIGMAARVTITSNPTPLRVRSEPVVGDNVLAQIPEGTQFQITGGPSCWQDGGNNFTFWQIQLEGGQTGWVAEGTASGYFIEPLP